MEFCGGDSRGIGVEVIGGLWCGAIGGSGGGQRGGGSVCGCSVMRALGRTGMESEGELLHGFGSVGEERVAVGGVVVVLLMRQGAGWD